MSCLHPDTVSKIFGHYAGQLNSSLALQAVGPDNGALNLAQGGFLDVFTKLLASLFQSVPGGTDPVVAKQDVINAAMAFYTQHIEPALSQAINRPIIFNRFIEPIIEKMIPQLLGNLYDGITKVLTGPTTAAPAAPAAGSQAPPSVPTGFVPY